MSKNDDVQISIAHAGGQTDTPKGVIPSPAAASPQPSPKSATTVAPKTLRGNFGVMSTVA